MASLANDPGGTRRVLVMVDGKRKPIRLGKVPKKQAESILRHVEALSAARIDGSAPPAQTAAWLSGVSEKLRTRLAAIGLAEARDRTGARTSIGELVGRFKSQKYPTIKPQTAENYSRSFKVFGEHIGTAASVDRITVGDAEAFRDSLIASGLAESTVRRRCADACILMGFAVKHRIIDRNPFVDAGRAVPRTIQPTRRTGEVTRETFVEFIEHVHEPEMRLVYALSRFGGLRMPSEASQLTWGDIDWERGRFTVHSPKTERHEGRDRRVVPIFPELAKPLEDAFDQAEAGELYVLPTFRRRCRQYARLHLLSVLKRAGIDPWPRLLHNMRVTRQTELEADYPTHVVCAWLGNSPKVAHGSYLKVRDVDFERASEVAQKAAQRAPANGRNESQHAQRPVR